MFNHLKFNFHKFISNFDSPAGEQISNSKRGFTLIEILVVITIIGLMATVSTITYISLTKSSRDTRRKADLEQIRAALEQYRSANVTYPTNATFQGAVGCSVSTGLSDPAPGTGVYLSNAPEDPRCTTYRYYYNFVSASDYTLGAFLEGVSSTCATGGTACGTGVACNYCVGPYGAK